MEKFGKVCKEYIIGEIGKRFVEYPDFFITTFSQVGVNNMEKLRKEIKKSSAAYMVVKNSMLKHAMEKSGRGLKADDMTPLLGSGSCGVLFSREDAVAVARSLVDFTKEYNGLKIQGAFLSGKQVTADTVKHLASLPSREVLLAMAVSGIKAPISGFVGLLGGLLRNLVGVIDSIKKKKES